MRKITLWFVSTVAVVVLLFSYRTSRSATSGGVGGSAAPSPGVVAGSDGGSTANGGTGSSGTGGGGTGSGTVNGSVAQTRWGPVQVRVTIAGGRITDVTAVRVPNGNRRDDEINAYAVPRLRAEVLAAQSADIDSVSGATVTSDGYRTSLQAALDVAHFGG